jgi:hypothetical protein
LVLSVSSISAVVMSRMDRRGLLARGVVDQDVQPAQLAAGVGHQPLAERFVADVARDQHRLAAFGADQLQHFARVGSSAGR